MSAAPVRVLVDARILGARGGMGTFIAGLAQGFRELNDSSIELSFAVFEGNDQWLAPHLPGSAKCIFVPAPGAPTAADRATKLLMRWPALHRALQPVYWRLRGGQPVASTATQLPAPDEVLQGVAADLIHFAHQTGFATDLPSIYHPHDLQHLHLPELFTDEVKTLRDAIYRPMCEQASVVAVASSWVKEDLLQEFGLDRDKVRVVPLAPPDWEVGPVPSLPPALGIPRGDYVFYPAVAWRHKNHARLLDAIQRLRHDGRVMPVVLTGGLGENADSLREQVRQRGLEAQVWVLGVVSNEMLQALYRNARAVVIPTLFEAGSFPMWEAFEACVPVAASSVTSLPAQAGDAAVIFDPYDPADIAAAIARVMTDDDLRARLVRAGTERIRQLSWRSTARHFAALYRFVTDGPLSDEDQRILSASPPY